MHSSTASTALPATLSRMLRLALTACVALALAACAGLPQPRDPLRINVAGIEPLPTEGLELRFTVKLRVQNPNDSPVEYRGVALDLAVNGRDLASGVSSQAGSIAGFGEAVLSVPVTISAFAALRQALGVADGATLDKVPYVLTGKLAGGLLGTTRFTDQGTLSWPGTPAPGR